MDHDENDVLDATEEQFAALRELGVLDSEIGDLSFAEAETWINELRAMREDAGRVDML